MQPRPDQTPNYGQVEKTDECKSHCSTTAGPLDKFALVIAESSRSVRI